MLKLLVEHSRSVLYLRAVLWFNILNIWIKKFAPIWNWIRAVSHGYIIYFENIISKQLKNSIYSQKSLVKWIQICFHTVVNYGSRLDLDPNPQHCLQLTRPAKSLTGIGRKKKVLVQSQIGRRRYLSLKNGTENKLVLKS